MATEESQAGIPEPEEPERKPLPKLGATLGSYKIVKLLGVGGMGRVYVAEHVRLGRKVALKLLLPEFSSSPEVVQRFFNEARAVNQINHPNIVEIVDFVEDPHGFNYFIMELLDGRDLRKVREADGPFLLGRAIAVAKQVASALASAHGQGIVHRDIKPDNVLLCPREEHPNFVKLLDFGIAKLTSGIFQEQKTRLGMVLGTPGYMSPEQAFGRAVDGRSDIYSLGVLLHWMLVDKLPSDGNAPMKATEAPHIPLVRTARGQPIPAPLAQLIERCLKFDPDDRIQTMDRLLAELKPFAPTAVEPGPEEQATVLGAPFNPPEPVPSPLPPPPRKADLSAKAPAPPESRAPPPRPLGIQPPLPLEAATRLKRPLDPGAIEIPPPTLPARTTGRLWLIGLVTAAAVVAIGWATLQKLHPPPVAPDTAVTASAPLPPSAPPAEPGKPLASSAAAVAESTRTAALPPAAAAATAPKPAGLAAPVPAEVPRSEPPAHRAGHAPARKPKPPASKPADDTTILDPFSE